LTVQRAVELRIYVKSINGYTVALAQVLSEPDNIIAAYEAEKVSDRSFYLTESALKDTTDAVRQEITKLEEQSSTILDKEKVARVWGRLEAMSGMIWEASALWAPADNPAALEDLKRTLEVTAPWIGGLGMGVRMFGPKTIPRQGIANIAQESSAFVDKMKPGSLKSDSQLSRDLLLAGSAAGDLYLAVSVNISKYVGAISVRESNDNRQRSV
jgi:hypothetical protein